MLPYVEIFGKTIGMYAVMSILGFFACAVVLCILGRKHKILIDDIILLMLAVIGGIMVGAHILYGITNLPALYNAFINCSSFGSLFKTIVTSFSGMVFYGGFIGSLVALKIYTSFSRTIDPALSFDLLAVATPLFHFFGRIGCFLGGCCYGVESDFGFTAHNNHIQPAVNDVSRFPVQLVESFANLIVFLILLHLFKREKRSGNLIDIYILMYSPIRFILEYLRGDEIRGILFGLSTSQWISIILVLFVVMRRIHKNKSAVV